jgi:hypothetical protein
VAGGPEYLDDALAGFSGYLAADELYDGPFCVLSVVDNRAFRRLAYDVLDAGRNPTCDDVRRLFARLKAELDARGLTVRGVTTDGSELYPGPVRDVLGPGVRHQVCRFHVLKRLTKAVLDAAARVRKQLNARVPRLPRGTPATRRARAKARAARRLRARSKDLFEHRHLLVRRRLTRADAKALGRVSRGLPHLRALRQIMDEVYRLFDRRCRAETALARLAALRRRVRRFRWVGKALRRLFSPNLEQALTFLDDRLLPSTSNAVERGNRRHRKMQRSVYSVRTRPHLCQRMALDLLREMNAAGRQETIRRLHRARSEGGKAALTLLQ